MQDQFMKRMPTGLTTLDPVFDGGIPPGSLVLLKGEIGSGKHEFVYTSVINLSLKKGVPHQDSVLLPENIRYITVTKVKTDIIREIEQSFNRELLQNLDDVEFSDLSDIYFDSSVVPFSWYSTVDNVLERMQTRKIRENVLASLSDMLGGVKPGSLVVLDSLTEIASQHVALGHWGDLTAYLRGLQRISKIWGTTIYLILTKGILDEQKDTEISDAVDAVVHFKWEESSSARRQRVMYIEKFRGVMIHLEERELVKFAVSITPGRGFEVSNIRVVV